MPDPLPSSQPASATGHVDVWLWTGLLLSPLAMGLNTIAGFTMAHWTADTGRKHLSYLISTVDFVLCLCGLAISILMYRKFHGAQDDVPVDGRRIFMAKLSLLLSMMAMLVVIAGTLAVMTLHSFD